MKILLVDNYDSFTYNIVELLRKIANIQLTILQNDNPLLLTPLPFDKIILSPGPDVPNLAGHLLQVIENNYKHTPILGICLGHQAIAQYFGATLVQLPKPQHGVTTLLEKTEIEEPVFANCETPISVGLYHSWAVSAMHFPSCMRITSMANSQTIMSIRHTAYNCVGIQFHPESYMTPQGLQMIKNWLAQ